LYVYLCRSTW